MQWAAARVLILLATATAGCGGDEPTGGDCTPTTEDFVDDRLVPAVQFAEASKSGELSCSLICPPGTTACEDLGAGGVGGANVGGTNAGGANVGGTNAGGANAGGTNAGGANAGGTNAGGANAGGTSAGGGGTGGASNAHLVRCTGTVTYPCG